MKRGQKDPTTGITDGEMPIFKGGRISLLHVSGAISFAHWQTGDIVTNFGYLNDRGYMITSIAKKNYKVHRLVAEAFLPDYSECLQVDHINGIRSDNRPINLRMVNCATNNKAFRTKPKGTSSRFRGVSWNKKSVAWTAQIRVDGTLKWLGAFDVETEAAQAYNMAAHREGFSCEALNAL